MKGFLMDLPLCVLCVLSRGYISPADFVLPVPFRGHLPPISNFKFQICKYLLSK